jgi:hypothetical protein
LTCLSAWQIFSVPSVVAPTHEEFVVSDYWPILVGIGSFLAAVVALLQSAVNTRKSLYETDKLRRELTAKDGLIRTATPEEVKRYGKPRPEDMIEHARSHEIHVILRRARRTNLLLLLVAIGGILLTFSGFHNSGLRSQGDAARQQADRLTVELENERSIRSGVRRVVGVGFLTADIGRPAASLTIGTTEVDISRGQEILVKVPLGDRLDYVLERKSGTLTALRPFDLVRFSLTESGQLAYTLYAVETKH